MAAIDFPNSPAVNDIFTAGTSSYRWTGVAWVSNNLGQIDWDDVTNKPSTFAPSAHTHPLADITDVVITDEATGEVLQWNGTAWVNATVEALPSQSGNGGKYLTTDGSTASWATITTDPTPQIFLLMGA